MDLAGCSFITMAPRMFARVAGLALVAGLLAACSSTKSAEKLLALYSALTGLSPARRRSLHGRQPLAGAAP